MDQPRLARDAYVSARGLTTSLIPNGATALELEFDFVAGALVVRTTDGGERRVALADRGRRRLLRRGDGRAGGARRADRRSTDAQRAAGGDAVRRRSRAARLRSGQRQAFWRALVQIDRVFHRFRSRFLGKVEPGALLLGQLSTWR